MIMAERDTLIVIVLLACVGLSFLFSGMESGVMAMNRLSIRHKARSGDKRAVVLQKFMDEPEDFLWTILVGNTMANFLIFGLGLLQLGEWLRSRPIWLGLGFFAGMFLFYIICELLPKLLFQRFPNRLTLGLARPFRFIHITLAPLVSVVDWFARWLLRWTGGKAFTGQLFGGREELRLLMQESASGLTTEEKAMINRVLDLQSHRVRHVVVPMNKAATVLDRTPISEALAISREKQFTRLPVIDSRTGKILGLLQVQELMFLKDLDLNKTAKDYVQPALFLKGNLLLEDALHRMQRGGARLAVVLDASNMEIGIISLQDILRAIFGEVTL